MDKTHLSAVGQPRREFLAVLGAGLLISVPGVQLLAQSRRGGSRGPQPISARVHIGEDGRITVMTGKIEMGQGARAEISQAAAEELRVPVDSVQLIMGDTGLVPDDGLSAGSRTTPSTLPAVRQGAASAREVLVQLAASSWNVPPGEVQVQGATLSHKASNRSLTYAQLARDGQAAKALNAERVREVTVTPVNEWRVMGQSIPRPNRRDLVTGKHLFPSDHTRPGMLYGKVLRAPSYGARLVKVDVAAAKAMKDVVVVQEDQFIGVAAPSTFIAEQALKAISDTAEWERPPHPSSRELYEHLKSKANPADLKNRFQAELAAAKKTLQRSYRVPYVQHVPMETRVALAEWESGKLTVWTGTQNPFGYRNEISGFFKVPGDAVRVIVPDFGCGFGGKHTAEAAIEAARLARAAGRPVRVRWTREEEFTWAYFRPAGVIETEATLDEKGTITSWHFININSGGAAVETPYRVGQSRCRSISSQSPLRQGSYRTLAATANTFARECLMDELAAEAGMDALEFRLKHLENPRLRAVLSTAAEKFNWAARAKEKREGVGVGLACGTEKGSFVAACVEIAHDAAKDQFVVRRVCEVFECGAVVNTENLTAQIKSCIIMGLGPALREEMRFSNGEIRNGSLARYLVPRFEDVPELDIHILHRPDLPSVGGGETPIIAVAPAVANAAFRILGRRFRELPIRPTDVAETA